MRLRTRPTCPWRNWANAKAEFTDQHYGQPRLYRKNEYPCIDCHARGKVRHLCDHDPVEGWKNAPWHCCLSCNGNGLGSRKHFMVAANAVLKRYQKDLQVWRKQQRILRKLSPAERRYILG